MFHLRVLTGFVADLIAFGDPRSAQAIVHKVRRNHCT